MQITDFHATYYAYLLTRHSMENSIETLAATLQDSKVDLNPHQIEAALFALRSPYSRGIIEADEVGLGKTIVAGIVMAQKWAEEKRRVLVIVPANLRRQWQLELEEKFYLPAVIVDGDSFNKPAQTQNNPFFLNEIVITSYNFAHSKASKDEKQKEFTDLADRLKGICIRTLRRQVSEYIKYTERLPITQEFTPTPAEQELYNKFSKYLQRNQLWALPDRGRHLISLLLWKLLASSTFAIAGTLETLMHRLQTLLESGYYSLKSLTGLDLGDDISFSDYEEQHTAHKIKPRQLTESEKISLRHEIDELKAYHALAISIDTNAKGEALLVALEKGFAKLNALNAPQKAVIFTESRRTQEYLQRILETDRYKGKTQLYHGGMNVLKLRPAVESATHNLLFSMIKRLLTDKTKSKSLS